MIIIINNVDVLHFMMQA